jgi:hypothetical protein
MVIDGEIAVPDEKGATHIGDLQDELARGNDDRHALHRRAAVARLRDHRLEGADMSAHLRAYPPAAACPGDRYGRT